MALPLLAPALFFIGGNLVKAGSKKIGEELFKQGIKRATTSQIKNAKQVNKVTTLKQAKELGQGGKKTKAVLATLSTAGAITAAKPAGGNKEKKTGTVKEGSGQMKRNRPAPKTRKAPDRSADTVSRQQLEYQRRGGIDPKKPKKTAKEVNKLLGGGMDKKTWRDVKSVAAAKRAGLKHFTGKDGKKKLAVTKADLDKMGMTLRQYANSLRK
jgi:hypothetical protein